MTMVRGLKIALSLFLAFHLFCILIAPNSQNYLGARVSKIVAPYVTFFELGSQWGFFAPDPGPPPLFVEYELLGQDGQALLKGSWPEKSDPFILRERQNRRISVTRFAMNGPDRIEKSLAPYFCRLHPEARSVHLWRVVQHMANLHDVAEGKRKIDDGLNTERKWITQYLCGEKT